MNPFEYSGPIVEEDPQSGLSLVERIKIVNSIHEYFQRGEYVQVVGPHQSGQTTLAIDLIDRFIPEDDFGQNVIPVLISCESLMDAEWEGFVREVMTRLRRVLKEGVPEDKCQNIRSILFSEDKYPNTFLELHLLLVEIGDELKETTGYLHYVFLVDEIEAMPDHLVVEVLRFFRGLFSHYAERRWESPYRVIIFTTYDLACRKLGRGSPYNISDIILLKPFSREEFDTMLDEQHVKKVLPNVTFDKSARDRIMAESGGYPHLIQRLCHIMVERYYPGNNSKITLGKKEVLKAVLEIFEKGDDNLQKIYREATLESNEWILCMRLAAGHREPYAANDPVINKLVELGIVADVKRYCYISTGLYQRQILKIYFDKEYQTVIESFPDKKQLLLNISCLQEILLNDEIKHLVFTKIEEYDMPPDSDEIPEDLLSYLDEILKGEGPNVDMEEIHTYINYYNMEPVEDVSEIMVLLSKVFAAKYFD